MKRTLTIIKIGGSVLTYKDSADARLRTAVLKQLAKELSTYRRFHNEDFILVHGAGSFGHPIAKRYSLNDRDVQEKDKTGVGLTHTSMHSLSSRIGDIFLEKNCPVFCFSPGSLITKGKKGIDTFSTVPLKAILDSGMIPLLHGDVVVDKECQFSICSGDEIVSYLSNACLPKRVFFLCDVEGIFTDNPKLNRFGTRISETTRKELQEMVFEQDDGERDVTGSMGGKISEIVRIGCDTYVFNGLKKENLLRSLQGERMGTKIFGSVEV